MKKSLIILMFSLPLFFIAFVGCANKEIVKEESVAKENVAAEKQPGAQEAKASEAIKNPAAKEAPATMPGGERTAKEESLTAKASSLFKDIHFDFDNYNLKPEAREILKKKAAWLANNVAYNVRIEGNCDERGTEEYNLALGQRRADEAMKYLVELGIEKRRIKTISYGKDKPLDSRHNEEAWAKNRRDHFVVTQLLAQPK